jgi:hypothetical protein
VVLCSLVWLAADTNALHLSSRGTQTFQWIMVIHQQRVFFDRLLVLLADNVLPTTVGGSLFECRSQLVYLRRILFIPLLIRFTRRERRWVRRKHRFMLLARIQRWLYRSSPPSSSIFLYPSALPPSFIFRISLLTLSSYPSTSFTLLHHVCSPPRQSVVFR